MRIKIEDIAKIPKGAVLRDNEVELDLVFYGVTPSGDFYELKSYENLDKMQISKHHFYTAFDIMETCVIKKE